MSKQKGKTRTITVASGKGGVGKTHISLNLAISLSARGYRTCLFDADLGLANINILLGLNPEYDLEDVLAKGKSLGEIILCDPSGIDIVPGSSGVERLANLDADETAALIRSFDELEGYDFLLFDTSAGISRNVIAFCLTSCDVILVITPEPTSMTDAYALLKILTQNGYGGTARVVVNQCRDLKVAKSTYNTFKTTVEKFLKVDIAALGPVVWDQRVLDSVKSQGPLMNLYPRAQASRCIDYITNKILKEAPTDRENFEIRAFWTRCLQFISGPMNLRGRQGGHGLKEQGHGSRRGKKETLLRKEGSPEGPVKETLGISAPGRHPEEPLTLLLEQVKESFFFHIPGALSHKKGHGEWICFSF